MSDPVPPNAQVPPGGVDPKVIMPPNVMAASRLAMEAHARAYGPAPPVQEGSASPAHANNGTGAPNGHANGQVPPAQSVVQEELPDVNPDGTPNYENRYKALRGRWEAEQRRMRETQEQYDLRMRDLASENARLKAPPLPGEQPMPVLLSQQEIADYGADFLDVVKRAAVEAVMPMMKPIAQEIGTVKARVETAESETGKQFVSRMHSTMDQTIPGWKDLNEDPNFIAWTRQNDIFSGLNRQEMLQRAWYAGDSNRVAAFFNGFLAEEAAVNPAAAQQRQQAYGNGYAGHVAPPNGVAPAPSSQQPAPRVSLESLAAPGRARPAGSQAPGGKPVWTAAGISQFYMDCANGKFRGRDAERVATETDLMAAQREGRIQVNPRTAMQLPRS